MIDETSAFTACYTSGTTGRPKGVYFSHRCIYLHTLMEALTFNVTNKDVLLQTVPMFHCQGWGLFFSAGLVGAKLVFPGMYTAENLEILVDLMISEKVTINEGAPAILLPMLQYLQSLPERPHFENLRMVSGATEPPLAMMKGYAELGAEIIHAYGATETTPLATCNIAKPSLAGLSEDERWKLRSKQGLFMCGVEAKIVDADDNELPPDGESAGEILMKGPWITRTYYNSPEGADAFTDGYWRSGDVGHMDENGYVKVTDRFKDVIKSGGEWISSIDLENEIMAHPSVAEASVVGIAHPKWQERPLALVVVKPGESLTKEEILASIGERFAKWQLPDDVIFVDEIPKTSVGKFSKRHIREQYGDHYTT
jgi:fatty-acyl-CoA synthase